MAEKKFKYKINEHILVLPRHITVGSIEKILKKDHGISRAAFYRDRNVELDDAYSIPSERLDIYASLFGVTIEDMKNYTSKKIKPLFERKFTGIMQRIVKQAKMKKS
jgi:hypothetical protein